MRNLKIGTRLGLGFGLIIALMLVISGIGGWRMFSTAESASFLQSRQATNDLMLQWARQVEVNANQALAVANLTNPDILAVFKKGLDASDQQSTTLQKQIQDAITEPKAVEFFNAAAKTRETYMQGRTQAFKALDNGDYDEADTFFNREMPKITAQYIAQIDQLSKFQMDHVGTLFDQNVVASELGMTILAAVTLLSLILGPLFAWRVTRSVTQPLTQGVNLASAVAQRDLSHDIAPSGKDEVTRLEGALHDMVQGLRGTVSEVRSGANSIASAAAQITAGNLDLSSRTEQQASSLAQTAATMEQITATVRQNADNVQQANTLAATAAKTATSGGSIVAELVTTMGEINDKSQQVADIISVIDSIAFQTNILALNAAVEAARAGEQGRGFAVVASEVRALAQRSAAAAKEIKALIDTSVEATTRGNEQASHAGTTMQDIVDGINRVTDIMGEISAANREQTTGIEEINAAVTQMDDVTRQNASLVEESAAAASSLQAQADTLAHLVDTFRLQQQGQDAATHGAAAQSNTAGAAGARTAGEQSSQAKSGAARRAAPLPGAPEKVVSPAPRRARRTSEPATKPRPATAKPALKAPGQLVAEGNEEWTEF